MWIEPYHRDQVPSGTDNSEFGSIIPNPFLTNPSASFGFGRTITNLPDFDFPASKLYQADEIAPSHSAQGNVAVEPEELPKFLQACRASFRHAYTNPVQATVFIPDHAPIIENGDTSTLIEELLWHSELFYSHWFRVDRTTNWKWRVKKEWDSADQIRIQVDGLVNYCYHRYQFQYYHWFIDSLSRVWLLKNHSPFSKPKKWVIGPLDRHFHMPSLALFDIRAEDCMWLGNSPIIKFSEAVCAGFTFEEPLKTVRPAFRSGTFHRGWSVPYINELRDRAKVRYGAKNGEPSLRIFISRGDAQHRRLRNETAVIDLLEAHGFQSVETGSLSFADQVSIFSRAEAIVAIHGAGLTNLLWSPPGCTILELIPDTLGDVGYRFLSQLAGHQHCCILCPPFEHARGIAYADIEVDLVILRRALQELF